MPDSVLINGQATDRIRVSDRGLQYGDGLFETMPVINGHPLHWDRHMARLSRGEDALGLPRSDRAQLFREAAQLCEGCAQGVLKVIITRGSGGRGYRPPVVAQPHRILALHPWTDYPESWFRDGMRLRLCTTRWSRNRRLAGLKHLNRLEQVLARQEWRDPQIAEGVMLDEHDRVVSVTQGNLFLVDGGIVRTPELTHAGIAGVMRELVIESAAELGIPLQIGEITLEALQQAEALFVTNSLLGLCPVAALEERIYAREQIPDSLRQAWQGPAGKAY